MARALIGSRGALALEGIVTLALCGLVLACVCSVLTFQRRFYALYEARFEAWDAVAAGAEILSAEMRGLNPSAGDLYVLARDSVAFRSVVGFAYVCALDDAGTTWWLRGMSGSLETRPRDSALVFVEHDPARDDDDRWQPIHLEQVDRATAATCPGSLAAQGRARVAAPLPGLRPGAPLHAFRPYVYRAYRDAAGRTWLGRRLRGDPIQPVSGPLEPIGRGLAVEGFDGAGLPATVPASVARLRFTLRSHVQAGRRSVSEAATAAVTPRNALHSDRP